MANFSSMTALLGMLAVAGYENRDKLEGILREAVTASQGSATAAPSGGLGGLLGGLTGGGAGGLLGSVLSGLTGGQQGGLGGLLGSLVGGGTQGAGTGDILSGGLGQILQELQKNGLGAQAASWVSTGPNQEVAPHELGKALDTSVLSQLTQSTGLSQQELLDRLSQILPKAVDALTPNGSLPTSGAGH